jgi:CheY-like chemotaxis protein
MAAIAGRDPRHTITIDRIVKKLTKTNKKILYILTLLTFLSCSSSGKSSKPVRQSHLYKALLGAVNVRAESPPATQVGQAATKSTAIQPGRHVLLVEDNPVNTYAAELMLAHLGCEVTTKSNGKEAVEAVFKTPFDVVLMDCWMPEMDGFAATLEIRRREREYGTARSLPIIALAGSNTRYGWYRAGGRLTAPSHELAGVEELVYAMQELLALYRFVQQLTLAFPCFPL